METELVSNDWNTLILHFLGLDHIGHKTGSRSVHMHPKQKEMDTLVQRIVVAQETHRHLSSALFVLCGDHGMTEGGNHGGSSSSETSTAMLLISPKFRSYGNGTDSPLAFRDDFKYHVETGQSDIIPSLAAMLGFSIPKNSLGILIPEILPLWPCKSCL